MKEFKVTTYLTVSMEATVCAEDRAEAVAKAMKFYANGELEPDEFCVERESNWAYPTGRECDLHNHPPAWAHENPAKIQQDRDSSKAATAVKAPRTAKEMLQALLGEV